VHPTLGRTPGTGWRESAAFWAFFHAQAESSARQQVTPAVGQARLVLTIGRMAMKENPYRSSPLLLMIIMYLVTACGNGQTITKSPVTSTATITVAPSETSSSNFATLAGIVVLSNDNKNPFPTSVELHLKHSLIVTHQLETDSAGKYTIDNIQPGAYEFWILITADSSMVPGCSDVVPADEAWLGIKYGDDKAVTLEENASLSRAFEEAVFMFDIYGTKADGFYAIIPDLEIESGLEYKMDIVLMCK
jgi:hypothetical protein